MFIKNIAPQPMRKRLFIGYIIISVKPKNNCTYSIMRLCDIFYVFLLIFLVDINYKKCL